MNDFVATGWRPIFDHNGLRDFEDFWRRSDQWFEKPNRRRGGWSGVSRCELSIPDGGTVTIFLKRQENHFTRTLAHPMHGIPTLRREYEMLSWIRREGVPATVPLYFAQRRDAGCQRAILVTEQLNGYQSLEALTAYWSEHSWPSWQEKRALIQAIALVVRQLHRLRIKHNCLYPKHVFLKWPEHAQDPSGPVNVSLIDLEKARRTISCWDAAKRDLDTLHRHSRGWSRTDRWRFLRVYLGDASKGKAKGKWRSLMKRSIGKHDESRSVSDQK